MSHVTFTWRNQGNSRLLVVGSQIANLIPCPSFGHNSCFRCSNGSCEPILNIYVPRAFQWYKERLNPMSFDPTIGLWRFGSPFGTPTPKMGVHLGVWGFTPSHSFALSGAWGVTPRLPSWPAPLQALALVANPRLRLQHPSQVLGKSKFTTIWATMEEGGMGCLPKNKKVKNEWDKEVCLDIM